MSTGTVNIDYSAAESDITKIKQAIEKLQESKKSISSLNSSASSMTGKTAAAIVEQCTALDKSISELIDQLDASASAIHKTVIKYRTEDMAKALKIRNGGGI